MSADDKKPSLTFDTASDYLKQCLEALAVWESENLMST